MSSESRARFHVVDYVVFGCTIAVSLAIGVFVAVRGRKQQSNTEYLMGGRKMKIIPIAASLLVSYESTIGILGNPAEVYAYGTQFMLYVVAIALGLFMGLFVFLPMVYPLRITSTVQYYAMRFNSKYVEVAAVILNLMIVIMLCAILIYSPCLAFETVSGFPAWISMLISGLVGVIYTSIGGMKAVVWTDVFQTFVIFAGLVTLIVKGTIEVGGVREVWRINNDWGRVKFFDFRIDPTIRLTFWTVCVINSLLWATITMAQASVQRFMTLPTMKKAKITGLLVVPGFFITGTLACMCGATAFAYYSKKGCDPLAAGLISGPNEIIPYFVMDVLNVPSLPGLFIACLFSAALSSISSMLNGMAAIFWENGFRAHYGHLPPAKQALITKVITFVCGCVCIVFAFLIMQFGGTLVQVTYSILGGVGGPLLGLLIAGSFMPKAGPRGVIVGIILAFSLITWLSYGSMISGKFEPPLPGPTYNCTGVPDNSTGKPYTVFDTTPVSGAEPIVTAQPEQTSGVLIWLYSLTYFWYPALAILIVTFTSILFYLTGLEVPQKTPKKFLVPLVRPCVRGDDSDLDEPKATMVKLLEPLTHRPPHTTNIAEPGDVFIQGREDANGTHN